MIDKCKACWIVALTTPRLFTFDDRTIRSREYKPKRSAVELHEIVRGTPVFEGTAIALLFAGLVVSTMCRGGEKGTDGRYVDRHAYCLLVCLNAMFVLQKFQRVKRRCIVRQSHGVLAFYIISATFTDTSKEECFEFEIFRNGLTYSEGHKKWSGSCEVIIVEHRSSLEGGPRMQPS